ncbi:MAG: ATP-binding cassette domain-containing protein [Gammaproteobacteria bacterium]|nr:MAG: ATP-binding cassette domain-containing protein [Gammaproteobacteria bacterium]
MTLISVQQLEFGIGGQHLLLAGVDMEIENGERICVVGRNGAGKSTLLKLLAGEIQPDEGSITRNPGTVVARLAQEVPVDTAGTVYDVVAAPLGEQGRLLAAYHHLAAGDLSASGAADRLGDLQTRIEAGGGWDLERRVDAVVTRLELPGDADFATLSGGMRRRVLLAQALVLEPDVLLLDEPTNHLDIAAIDWLEGFLASFPGSIVFITHDRRFLRALATRIVEIDRGGLTSWPGDYDNYLRRREERLHAEQQARAHFDRKLAEEEVWIRQGIKARRTRNEGRVRALEQMRRERAQRIEREGRVKMTAASADRSGKRVVELEHVNFGWPERRLIEDFSTTILRGDRVGLVGANGAGKTTLLRLMLGDLAPDSGKVTLGTGLEIAYFDQQRAQLDDSATAVDNVAEGRDFIELDGKRRHVISYLQDFLFAPDRARAPITRLSGGERNRLLLARLFAQPSNLLVMDEPTNDLDVETLELLEELLVDYPGTLLLVSHDREFLDNVVTSLLVLDGSGSVEESVGGYSDWLARRSSRRTPSGGGQPEPKPTPIAGTRRRPRKLTYAQSLELEALPQKIEHLEARLTELSGQLSDPELHRKSPAATQKLNAELASTQAELDAAFARWEELDALAENAS